MASSNFAEHVRAGRWTVREQSCIWDRAEINQIYLFCNDKFSHGCEKFGLLSGYVIDMTEGYNSKKMYQKKVWQYLEKDEPRLLVGTLRNTLCSNLWLLFGKPCMGPSRKSKVAARV